MQNKIVSCLIVLICLVGQCAVAGEAFFDSNGVKLRYLVSGKGAPVILIHGFAVRSAEDMWVKNALMEPKVIEYLEPDFQVIALELRGHGQSGKPLDPQQYGLQMVEDIVRLMDHLQLQQAHVVGYSLGAALAGKLLVTHPDRLLSVTFGGGSPVFEPKQKTVDVLTALAESLERGDGAGPLVPLISPAGLALPAPDQVKSMGQLLVQGQNQKALAAVVRGIKELEVTGDQLRATKVPVLIVYGNKEGEAIERIHRVTAVLPQKKVVVIDGGDHITTFGAFKFRKAIREFLKAPR